PGLLVSAESNSAGSFLNTMLNGTYSTCLTAIRQPGALQDGEDDPAGGRKWVSESHVVHPGAPSWLSAWAVLP
ncbi:MAG: hypothetical protein J7M39_15805, partial [Anaerolineae bacterium]|nr:hypothetical protein [Anaerolineae bacterium]